MTYRQTYRLTDKQTDRAWHGIMWCDDRSIHSTAERGLSASLSAPLGLAWHAHRPHSMHRLALAPPCAADRRCPPIGPLLACLLASACLLAYACLLLHAGSPLAPIWLNRPFAWPNGRSRSTGLQMAYAGIVGSLYARMSDAGMSAMGPQAISGRSETFWHADGTFGQGTV